MGNKWLPSTLKGNRHLYQTGKCSLRLFRGARKICRCSCFCLANPITVYMQPFRCATPKLENPKKICVQNPSIKRQKLAIPVETALQLTSSVTARLCHLQNGVGNPCLCIWSWDLTLWDDVKFEIVQEKNMLFHMPNVWSRWLRLPGPSQELCSGR